MANNDSIKKTLTVAFLLCLVCSIVVSMSAILLRPAQEANKALDLKKSILAAAGLLEEGKSVEELFEKIETRVVDLDTGLFTDAVSAESFDQRKSAKNPDLSERLDSDSDLAKILRREKYSLVYLVRGDDSENSEINTIILPIRGYGLWSTLYGFIALQADANTVVGLGFYEHAETPGLGGEVDNPRWKAMWPDKKIYNSDGDIAIEIIKGVVNPESTDSEHQIDGLSGATLTSKGVHNLLNFWLDQDGFKPFLDNLRTGEI